MFSACYTAMTQEQVQSWMLGGFVGLEERKEATQCTIEEGYSSRVFQIFSGKARAQSPHLPVDLPMLWPCTSLVSGISVPSSFMPLLCAPFRNLTALFRSSASVVTRKYPEKKAVWNRVPTTLLLPEESLPRQQPMRSCCQMRIKNIIHQASIEKTWHCRFYWELEFRACSKAS